MEFTTERLILRPWKETDATELYEYAKNPKIGPIAGWPIHTSIENSREIIKKVLSAEETYAVCLKEDNRAIGSIALIPPMQSHTEVSADEIEIGYWIGVPYWGQGLIPEAVSRLQKHVFEDLGCSAMWCGYYDGNEKSKRCQEKCGFVYHHTEKDKPCRLMGDIRTEHFTKLTKEQWSQNKGLNEKSVVLYIHGKGGSAAEAEHYKALFPECDCFGLDYKTATPWEAKEEIISEVNVLIKKYKHIILVANSIGAFFSMNALSADKIEKAFFISPILNMEKLIQDMMKWANVTENELQKRGVITTEFGEDLSWEYLTYVRKNPIKWKVPTKILYGEKDHLTSMETVSEFAKMHDAELTVLEEGEHWFHTKEQMNFLDQWIKMK